jgi:hypothetical protein
MRRLVPAMSADGVDSCAIASMRNADESGSPIAIAAAVAFIKPRRLVDRR